MDEQDYKSCYFAQKVTDLPMDSCRQCRYYADCEKLYQLIKGEDPCGGRDCDTCEIGGCDHGIEVV